MQDVEDTRDATKALGIQKVVLGVGCKTGAGESHDQMAWTCRKLLILKINMTSVLAPHSIPRFCIRPAGPCRKGIFRADLLLTNARTKQAGETNWISSKNNSISSLRLGGSFWTAILIRKHSQIGAAVPLSVLQLSLNPV